MSRDAQTWFRKLRMGLSPLEKLIGGELAYRAVDDTHLAWPTLSRLSDDTETPKRTVQRALINLEKRGIIVRAGEHKHSKAIIYRMAVNVEIHAIAPDAPNQDSGQSDHGQYGQGYVANMAMVTVANMASTNLLLKNNLTTQSSHGDPLPEKGVGKKSAIKEDWQPSEADIAFAETRAVSCETEVERFRLYHLAKRSLMASWSAAWRTWVLNAVRFGNTRSAVPVVTASLAIHDPADAYGATAWAKSLPDAKDGTMPYGVVPCLMGIDAAGMALDICTAAGLPSTWRGDLSPVADWLRAEFDPDLILSTIRTGRKPLDLKSLRYFDSAVREAQNRDR